MRFNSLIPELYVSDYVKSIHFYTQVLGFVIEYERTDPLFAFLSYEGSQLMIQQTEPTDSHTGALEHPYGRGVNFEIRTRDIEKLAESLHEHKYSIRREAKDHWRKTFQGEVRGSREIHVLDPDGYFLRFSQTLEGKH